MKAVGHSYFSRLFCNCMTYWLGAAIPPTPAVALSSTELIQFAPIFHPTPVTITQPYATFLVSTGSSEIQPAVVPAAPLTITFPTWAALAEEVGMSRLYGGIHCMSAHTGSVAVANSLYPLLQEAWNIVKSV